VEPQTPTGIGNVSKQWIRHTEVMDICEKFTVAMSGSAPYAQQIVTKPLGWLTQVFRLIY
jgi:hypothetical protein